MIDIFTTLDNDSKAYINKVLWQGGKIQLEYYKKKNEIAICDINLKRVKIDEK